MEEKKNFLCVYNIIDYFTIMITRQLPSQIIIIGLIFSDSTHFSKC